MSISLNGLADDVVIRLLENKFNKGYSVFVDNFYTSPNLFLDLFNKGVSGTGTVRTNRKNFPSELREAWDKKPPRGTSIFRGYGPITAVRWFANKDVYALSTYEGDDILTSVRRRHEGETSQTCCPNIISSYNSSMGGVDLTDQYMSYYSVGRKTTWWSRVFWHMHDHAAIDGLVVHRSNCRPSEKPVTNKQFSIQLAYALVTDFVAERWVSACLSDPPRRFQGKHFPYKAPKRSRCRVCAYKKISPRGKARKDTKTSHWCPKCEIYLCVGRRIELYHTRLYLSKLLTFHLIFMYL